ncbi:MAG: T9SS type A sorting domain-containing protein [Bacteroidales bacterium]|nr:T9SS type A sorting domain-containing protein [Bacteroidales bacterium]MCF8403642.1 T9SS type A sorting domain-containing protein [Bacteroidales bacterium]
MKKIILSLLLLTSAFWVYSQTLEIQYDGVSLEDGSEIMVATHPDSSSITLHGIVVGNTSSNPINVKCIRESVDLVDGTLNFYCWGLCYSPDVDTSLFHVQIDGLSTTSEFEGDYIHNGQIGVSKVKYTFYDMADENVTASFYVNYNITTALSVAEKKSMFNVSEIYPNPANTDVSIDYAIDENIKDAKFIIFSLLGSKVKEINVLENDGTIKLNTSDLIEGIYFYSFLINGESAMTQKLVIKH